ncbi:MAG: energy transducer TonB [Salibacteraceae bacterium]
MEVKKNSGGNLESRRKYFFQIGLVFGLAFALFSFEWTQFEPREYIAGTINVDYDEPEMIPITVRTPPKKELPAVKTEPIIIKVVEELTKPEVLDPIPEPEKEPTLVLMQMMEDEEPEIDEIEIFTVVEEMPEFIGGEAEMYKYLARNINYPSMAKDAGISGIVYLTFIVDEEGEISEVKLLRGIGGGCDEEAIRVFKNMPAWKPGKQRGNKVKVQYNMNVNFDLRS